MPSPRPYKKRDIVNYVKTEFFFNHYPSRRHIESIFHIRLNTYFNSIKDLYKHCNIKYKQINSQELKNKKANLLTKIAIDLIPLLNLKIIKVRGVYERGVDILTVNSNKNNIGIEIKANNKFEPIKKRNIIQSERFIIKENLKKVFIITTSSKIEKIDIPQNIIILNYDWIKKHSKNYHINDLNYIRNSSIHILTEEKQIKKQKIIEYVRNEEKNKRKITYSKILKDLNLDLYSYFNKLTDIYIEGDITPPLNKVGGRRGTKTKNFEITKNKIITYISNEIKNGKYPTGSDIEKEFNVSHIQNFITMSDLYNISKEELENIRKAKADKRGAFKKRIILEES